MNACNPFGLDDRRGSRKRAKANAAFWGGFGIYANIATGHRISACQISPTLEVPQLRQGASLKGFHLFWEGFPDALERLMGACQYLFCVRKGYMAFHRPGKGGFGDSPPIFSETL